MKNKIRTEINNREYVDCLNQAASENRHLPSFRYFTDLAYEWYREICMGPFEHPVIVLGTGIPTELLRAAGVRPFTILGGSHESCSWSDDLVPRDADPVSRSLLGFTVCPDGPDLQDVLFIIPLNCDNMRKIACLLTKSGKKVFTVDIPPIRNDKASEDKWAQQMIRMTEAAAEHVHGRVTASSLRRAVRQAVLTRSCMQKFLRLMSAFGDGISLTGRILVQNSLYWADDEEEWIRHMHLLMKEIKEKAGNVPKKKVPRPSVLVLGSPLYFPNDKLPRLLDSTGLSVLCSMDASLSMAYTIPRIAQGGRSAEKIVRLIARSWYRNDVSSSFMKNEVQRSRVRDLLEAEPVEGVILHVLKGQIEQDFELLYYEELFEELGIPLFRLETDYQYQDVEQLRIRMEAFREMLVQRRLAGRVAL